jgi:GNAT superfamily N-acetyltransferase
MIRIGLIGDFDESIPAHRAIPIALNMAADASGQSVTAEWISTGTIDSAEKLSKLDGLWCVPGGPYRSMNGALRAIRYAREHGRPFLGTCGGFQHAVIEYARNVLGWQHAEHAETSPDADFQVIAPLECALVEATGAVYFTAGSHLRAAYGADESTEAYRCSYGLNPEFRSRLAEGPLRVAAEDAEGDVRGLELDNHPFFVLTLFQPERAALQETLPPIVVAFVAAAGARAAQRQALRSGVTVRALHSSEWQAYRDIRLRALSESPNAFVTTTSDARMLSDRDWARRLENLSPDTDFPSIAEVKGQFAGLAWAKIHESAGDTGHLYQMWVVPERRGLGIGRMLLEAAIEWARSRQVRHLVLGVTCGDSPARRLYTSVGFQPVGAQEPLRPGSQLTVQTMRLEIRPDDA